MSCRYTFNPALLPCSSPVPSCIERALRHGSSPPAARPVGLKFAEPRGPPDWDAEFGFSGPLELEIGSGAGGHALEYCRRNPQRALRGLRVAQEVRPRHPRRGDKLGLKNLRVIEADARVVVPRIFAAGLAVRHPPPVPGSVVEARPLQARHHPAGLRPSASGQAGAGRPVRHAHGRGGPRRAECWPSWRRPASTTRSGAGVFHPYDPEEVPSTRERRYLQSGEPVYRARLVKPG